MARDIIQPVGRNCPNLPPDVMLMQGLLNRIPGLSVDGVNFDKLPVDGQISGLFVALLNKYQERNPAMRLENDRVEPGGVTIGWLNSWDPMPPLTKTAMMMCPHGGQVNIVTTGKSNPVDDTLNRNATLIVAGCANMMGPMGPSPCTTAKFIASALVNFVDRSAVGMCFSPTMVPQGPLIVSTTGAMMR